MKELSDLLAKKTIEELSALQRLLSIKKSSARKADRISTLIAFYQEEDCIRRLWNQLCSFDKELLTCIVQSDYHPANSEIDEIYKKYEEKRAYYSSSVYDKSSLLYAILLNGNATSMIRSELAKLIPQYVPQFKIDPYFEDTENYDGRIVGRSERYGDFTMLVKFISSHNVPASKSDGLMSKSSLIKFHKIAGYEDIFQENISTIDAINNIKETTVSYGMIQLLLVAQVVKIYGNKYTLGEKANYFVDLDNVSKAKFLFDSYMKCKDEINECQRITASKLSFGQKRYDLSKPRQTIVDMLALCPPGEWIDAQSFQLQIRKTDYYFLRSLVDHVYVRDDYHKEYYYCPSWGKFEEYFIDVILMEYLAVLGIVDVCTDNCSVDYDNRIYPAVNCFRLTDLGMYLLGLSDEYKSEETAGEAKGFVVKANFDIIVSDGTQRITHEIYFDRFMKQTYEDQQVSIYRLDFAGIVRALEIGLDIREIIDYLKSRSTEPIPNNVMKTLSDWESQSHRIRIRTVTVLETDEESLLEEIKNYKGMKESMLEEVRNAVEIQPAKVQKVKKLIENNKRFCILSK